MNLNDKINRVLIKENAKKIFYDENNRLKLIFSGIIPMLVFSATFVLIAGLFDGATALLIDYGILSEYLDGFYLAIYSIILVLTLPSLWGYMFIIKKAFKGEAYSVSDIFLYYRSPLTFLKTLIASAFAAAPFVLMGTIIYFAFSANNIMYEYIAELLEYDTVPVMARLIIIALSVVIILALAVLAATVFPYVAICTDESLGIFSSIPKTFSLSLKTRKESIKFALSFAGHIALSALTFGVIYVIYALPYMELSYIGYIEELQMKKDIITEINIVKQKDNTEEMNTINE